MTKYTRIYGTTDQLHGTERERERGEGELEKERGGERGRERERGLPREEVWQKGVGRGSREGKKVRFLYCPANRVVATMVIVA